MARSRCARRVDEVVEWSHWRTMGWRLFAGERVAPKAPPTPRTRSSERERATPILHHSSTPSLRVPGFEDDDEDENEAPHELFCFRG